MTMVVVSVALVGVLSVGNFLTAQSADPVIRVQAAAVAQGYMEEILLQSYSDPDGVEAGETRATFDDVDDYDGLADNGCTITTAACPSLGDCVCDQYGTPVPELSGYDITVSVSDTTLYGATARRIDVRTRHAGGSGVEVYLSGYRTDF